MLRFFRLPIFPISQSLNISLRSIGTYVLLTLSSFHITIYLWMQTTIHSLDNDAKEGTHWKPFQKIDFLLVFVYFIRTAPRLNGNGSSNGNQTSTKLDKRIIEFTVHLFWIPKTFSWIISIRKCLNNSPENLYLSSLFFFVVVKRNK